MIRVNCVAVPPVRGNDHQSDGTACAEATLMPRIFSSQVGCEACAGVAALKMIDWLSGEKMGASIMSGIPGLSNVRSCALLPSALATKSLFLPSNGSNET